MKVQRRSRGLGRIEVGGGGREMEGLGGGEGATQQRVESGRCLLCLQRDLQEPKVQGERYNSTGGAAIIRELSL